MDNIDGRAIGCLGNMYGKIKQLVSCDKVMSEMLSNPSFF